MRANTRYLRCAPIDEIYRAKDRALNGTSLTVNDVDQSGFGINFIPHTKSVTTWGDIAVGDAVNLEIDTIARYVARLQSFDR